LCQGDNCGFNYRRKPSIVWLETGWTSQTIEISTPHVRTRIFTVWKKKKECPRFNECIQVQVVQNFLGKIEGTPFFIILLKNRYVVQPFLTMIEGTLPLHDSSDEQAIHVSDQED
jgi:hypothetical protein